MIVITGAAGFISSVLVTRLNENNYKDLILVDDFSRVDRENNYKHKRFLELVDRNEFMQWLDKHHTDVDFIIHLGARTDTAEQDVELFNRLNLNYTKDIWTRCIEYNLPLIYASSAATYGNGELGFDDDHKMIPQLKPMNPYGQSKQDFDIWALTQDKSPKFWAGLKFFNVYGPNEFHKGRMASVIFHTYNQVKKQGYMSLFRSHRDDYENGQQLRDFIYVKDLADVIVFLMENPNSEHNGIYNLGTGKARSFYDLAAATQDAMGVSRDIRFIDIPEDIRENYQYFTEANMEKLRKAGFKKEFNSLEQGVMEYVKDYLIPDRHY
jgi:ADP-L-glycero-D-manno-heptose 6-epimerase